MHLLTFGSPNKVEDLQTSTLPTERRDPETQRGKIFTPIKINVHH